MIEKKDRQQPDQGGILDQNQKGETDDQGTGSWKTIKETSLLALKEKAGLRASISSLTGFRQFIESQSDHVHAAIGSGIEELNKGILDFIPEKNLFNPSKIRGKFRQEKELTESRRKANQSGKTLEVSLERAITASVKHPEVFNHLALLSGIYNKSQMCKQVAIDLVVKRHDRLVMIELKAWDNENDSPLSALMELSAYCLAYRKMLEFDSIRHGGRFEEAKFHDLVLMAPREYFEYWELDDASWLVLQESFESSLKSDDAGISMHRAVLDLGKTEFLDAITAIAPESTLFDALSAESRQHIADAFQNSMTQLLRE
jgi:hypothetical protein